MARVFVDTNVLVYLFDGDSPAKQARARALISDSGAAGDLVVSTQVLQEFYVTVTRKLARPLREADAEAATQSFASWPIVQIDTDLVFDAIDLHRTHQVSLWDALVIEAARRAGCQTLLTEDLQHGRSFGAVRLENPFLSP